MKQTFILGAKIPVPVCPLTNSSLFYFTFRYLKTIPHSSRFYKLYDDISFCMQFSKIMCLWIRFYATHPRTHIYLLRESRHFGMISKWWSGSHVCVPNHFFRSCTFSCLSTLIFWNKCTWLQPMGVKTLYSVTSTEVLFFLMLGNFAHYFCSTQCTV